MTMTPEQWADGAPGRATDPDGVAGYQCVDVPKDFFEKVTGKSWREGWPGAGNARDMLDTASTDWFQVIRNDPSMPNQLPQRFDIVVYGGTEPGGLNEWGHIGVTWLADQSGVTLIDQDGFQQRAMGYDRLGWVNPGTGEVIGWLRLKSISTINPSGGTVRPIPKEDDMTEYNDWSAASKQAFLKDMYKALWFGVPGAPLIQNRRLGRGEWPETLLGSSEQRTQRELLPPALAGVKATVDPKVLAASIPKEMAAQVAAELGKRITNG